jgi:hypothetical protein
VIFLDLNLEHIMSVFSFDTIRATAAAYNIQLIIISVSVTSTFSLPISTIISDLIILKFILWITNLRKIY